MFAWLNRQVFRFGRARRGAISIEFAFFATVVVVILFSSVEFGRYVLMSTKFDRAVTTIGDMFTQNDTVTSTDASEIFNAGQQVISPFTLGSDGVVIVSHVKAQDVNDPYVTWQVKGVGTGGFSSLIGTVGGKATLPPAMTLDKDEVVVVVELRYKYTPLLFDLLGGSSDIYRISFHRPRKSEEISYVP